MLEVLDHSACGLEGGDAMYLMGSIKRKRAP